MSGVNLAGCIPVDKSLYVYLLENGREEPFDGQSAAEHDYIRQLLSNRWEESRMQKFMSEEANILAQFI